MSLWFQTWPGAWQWTLDFIGTPLVSIISEVSTVWWQDQWCCWISLCPACSATRALPGPKAPLPVAITGYGRAEDRDKSQAAGFDAHGVKPVGLGQPQAPMMANPLSKAINGTEIPWKY